MANAFVEFADSDEEEEKRLNLLDVIEDKNRAANKVSLLTLWHIALALIDVCPS